MVDAERKVAVNNESADIARMLNDVEWLGSGRTQKSSDTMRARSSSGRPSSQAT